MGRSAAGGRTHSLSAPARMFADGGMVDNAPEMATVTFQAVLSSGHKGNAAEVPFDPGERWSLSARPLWPGRRGFRVHATVEGQAFDTAIVARSRRFWLLVPTEVSDLAGLAVGDSGSFSVAPAGPSGSAARKPHAA